MRKPSLFRRLVTSALVANCIILAPYGPPLAHAESTVVIGEVAWAGSSLSTADEWIELWNVGDAPVNVGGYQLQQGSDGTITLPTDAVIPPQSAYLVSNYAADDAKSVLAATSQHVTTGVSLSNSVLAVTLLDATGGIVDQAGTGVKPPAGLSGTVKATMIRAGETWTTATNSQGFDEGRTELGTPGFCDGCRVPEAAPAVVETPSVELPPVLIEAPSTEVVTDPVIATSTEPVAAPAVATPIETVTTPTVEAPVVETPVVESPISEVPTTPNMIPPCQVIYVPIEQPLPDSAVIEPQPTPISDSINVESSSPAIVAEVATTGTDPILSVPSPVEPNTTMMTDPILAALEPIINTEAVVAPNEELTAHTVEQTTQLSNDVATSSAQTAPDPVTETSTTTVSVPAATPTDVAQTEATTTTSATSVVTTSTPAPTTPAVPRYDLLRLNEFSAHPVGENEWLEITSLDPNTSIALADVMLYDGAGKIYTFATGTLDAAEHFVTAMLSSSRLNNDGDTVYLKDPNGNVLDSINYAGSKSGWTWSRVPDGIGAWVETPTSSPGDLNIPPPTETATATSTNPVVDTTVPAAPSTSATASPTAMTASPASVSSGNVTSPMMATVTSAPASTSTVAVPKKTVAKTKETKTTTVKETTTPKATTTKTTTKTSTTKTATIKTTKAATTTKSTTKTLMIPTISFNMNDYETSRGIRVSLQGQVGSPSGLLSSHAFILLSPDGRGLQVRVPTAKKLPNMSEIVVVQGTLLFTDAGMPYLKLGTNDDWKTLTDASQSTKPRAANLFTPSAEDAWSLVSATGTVRRINASSATIEIDGADVDVAIKKIIQYRLSRLSVGDAVSVTGLLDVSSDVPKIVPRNEQEIALVAHASIQAAKSNPTGLPGWTPFGAAGVAIAGTEGFKQLRDRRKRQALEEIVETRLNTTV